MPLEGGLWAIKKHLILTCGQARDELTKTFVFLFAGYTLFQLAKLNNPKTIAKVLHKINLHS